MVLAAGLGTRLRPLTTRMPKCMIPLGGRPLLEYTIRWLRRYGVTDVVINLHYLPGAVAGHFGDGAEWGLRITYFEEPQLLGTAGAVKNAASMFDAPFFIWYGDNLSTCRLDRLWAFHEAHNAEVTIALYRRPDATQSGIVDLGDGDRVTRFLEKPAPDEIFTPWVNAGILVVERSLVDAIPADGAVDFGRDVFPALLNRNAAVYGYRMSPEEGLWWIDRPEDLRHLEAIWSGLALAGPP